LKYCGTVGKPGGNGKLIKVSPAKKGDKAMSESSRIKFNPVTKEIEIEGSEKFVKTYFDKIQKLLSGPQGAVTAAPVKEKPVKKARPSKRTPKFARKQTGVKKKKKVSNATAILTFIKDSKDGITTAGLKEKAGLTDKQIWGIVYKAEKQGKIKKARRGVYVAV
jgi:hypothetical protein